MNPIQNILDQILKGIPIHSAQTRASARDDVHKWIDVKKVLSPEGSKTESFLIEKEDGSEKTITRQEASIIRKHLNITFKLKKEDKKNDK